MVGMYIYIYNNIYIYIYISIDQWKRFVSYSSYSMSKWGWTINKMGDMGMAQAISAPMDPDFYMLIILSVAIGHRRHSNLAVAIAPFSLNWDWRIGGLTPKWDEVRKVSRRPNFARGDPKAFSSWRRHAGGVGGQVRPQVGASIPPDFFVGFIYIFPFSRCFIALLMCCGGLHVFLIRKWRVNLCTVHYLVIGPCWPCTVFHRWFVEQIS